MASLTYWSVVERWRVTGADRPAPEICTETLVGSNPAVARPAGPPVTVLVTVLPVALPAACKVPHQRVGHLVSGLHLESRGAGAERQLLMAELVCIHAGHDAGGLHRLGGLRGAAGGIGDGCIDGRRQGVRVAHAAQVCGHRDLAAVGEAGTGEIKRSVTRFGLGVVRQGAHNILQPSCRCSTRCRYPCRSGPPCRQSPSGPSDRGYRNLPSPCSSPQPRSHCSGRRLPPAPSPLPLPWPRYTLKLFAKVPPVSKPMDCAWRSIS